MDLTLWHNPRCSKSRAALALLQEAGLTPTIRLYLQDPPTEAEITKLLAALALPPRDLLRRGEAPYRDLALKDADHAALIAAMVRHPILIERPILVAGDRARIGRPPEDILPLIGV